MSIHPSHSNAAFLSPTFVPDSLGCFLWIASPGNPPPKFRQKSKLHDVWLSKFGQMSTDSSKSGFKCFAQQKHKPRHTVSRLKRMLKESRNGGGKNQSPKIKTQFSILPQHGKSNQRAHVLREEMLGAPARVSQASSMLEHQQHVLFD